MDNPSIFNGLLNSKLLDWFIKQIRTTFRGRYFAANKQFLIQLLLHVPDHCRNVAKRIAEMVNQIELQKIDICK